MALIQWKQIDTELTSSVYTGSFNVSGSIVVNGQDIGTGYVLTSSFNSFTQSYYQDSSSFDIRITNLEDFSSSLDATFATDAELNQATASLSASIEVINVNFNSFTSSYNTGSFTGSFIGNGSGLTNISASSIIGLNLSQISSGSVSASISPNRGLQINTSVTASSFTGSFSGDGSQLTGIVSSKWSGSNPITRNSDVEITGSFKVSGSTNIVGPFNTTVLETNADTLIMTGSLLLTGSMQVIGLIQGTASFALTSSYIDGGFY